MLKSSSNKMCRAAARNGRALQYVPKRLCTANLCLAAVKQHRYALEFVPGPLRAEVLGKIDEKTLASEVV